MPDEKKSHPSHFTLIGVILAVALLGVAGLFVSCATRQARDSVQRMQITEAMDKVAEDLRRAQSAMNNGSPNGNQGDKAQSLARAALPRNTCVIVAVARGYRGAAQ